MIYILTKQIKMYQYFSKWREEWIDFTPTQGQLIQMEIYKYKVRKL